MQSLPIEVLRALMPAVQAISAHQRAAVREIELPRIDRKGMAAARAAGGGKYAYGHREIMAAVGYISHIDPDDDEDDSCGNCGYDPCRCEWHCVRCEAEECEGAYCECSCGDCDWEADE